MRLNKFYLLLILLIILGGLYAFSIFGTTKLLASLADNRSPNLLFTIIIPSKSQCPQCFNAVKLVDSIDTSYKLKTTNKKIIDPSSLIFKNLIKRYKLKNLPALIVSGDISNKKIVKAWQSLKGVKEKGNIVVQNLLPFYDLVEQRPRGIVDAILLKDKTCQKCFNENRYLGATKQIGLAIGSVAVYDIASSEGASLVKKYNISEVPAFLLSPAAGDYPGFASLWKEVGNRGEAGWFIFRKVQKMGKYENLKSKS